MAEIIKHGKLSTKSMKCIKFELNYHNAFAKAHSLAWQGVSRKRTTRLVRHGESDSGVHQRLGGHVIKLARSGLKHCQHAVVRGQKWAVDKVIQGCWECWKLQRSCIQQQRASAIACAAFYTAAINSQFKLPSMSGDLEPTNTAIDTCYLLEQETQIRQNLECIIYWY